MAANLLTTDDLRHHGYRPLDLSWGAAQAAHERHGSTRNFDLTGDVPAAGGTYLFTVDDGEQVAVMYVGMSSHLWMSPEAACPTVSPAPLSDTGGPATPVTPGSGSTPT